MANLLDVYARTAGLRIEKMHLFEHYFPLPVENEYVVFVTSAGHAVRAYSFYREVLWMLKDSLKEAGLATVQCGLKDDLRLGCEVDVCGLTDQNQFYYVLSKAKLIICGDTSALHIAGHYNVPIVSLFSTSDPNVSGSYFGDADKKIYLKPEFEGYTPTYNPGEFPKTIDRIEPERIAAAAKSLLNIDSREVQTVHMGSKYAVYAVEVIPDHQFTRESLPGAMLNLRYDIGGKEPIVYHFLQQRKCNVLTKTPLNVNALKALRGNLEALVYEIDDNYDLKFIDELKKHAIPHILLTDFSEEKLNSMKEIFMDYGLVQRRDNKTKTDIENADQLSESSKFRTSKFLISQGRIFMSRAHLNADVAVESFEYNEGTVIDSPEFWREQDFFYIFNEN